MSSNVKVSPEFIEERRAPRTEVENEGRLILQGLEAGVNCVVRNRSENGAGLQLDCMVPAKMAYKLQMEGEDDPVGIRAVWQHGRDVGVELKGTED